MQAGFHWFVAETIFRAAIFPFGASVLWRAWKANPARRSIFSWHFACYGWRVEFIFSWLADLFKGLYAAEQILLGVIFNVSVVGRGIQIVGKLHEVTVNLAVVCAHHIALLIQS